MATNINGKEYAWENVEMVFLGRPILGFIGFSYTTNREQTHLYGRGSEPLGIQSGNKSYEGTVTLLQSEVIAMNQLAKRAGANDLTEIAFNITLAYAADIANPKITRDIIKNAQISSLPIGMSQGDPNTEVELPFLALQIQYDV